MANLLLTRTIIQAALEDKITMKPTAKTVIKTVNKMDGTSLISVIAWEI